MQVARSAAPLDAGGFAAAMVPFGPFETTPMLAVAVSGGPDSLALALLAKHWTDRRQGSLTALTVDHGLRPESAAEARLVGRWLKARGISQRILRWQAPKPKARLQAEARKARYELLTAWCRARGVLHLLLGHQRDDQAETLLMRLERGSGPDGLAAMPALAERDGVRLLRPLLAVPRARLIAWLDAEGQAYVDDPSNRNPSFGRVRVRAALAALEEQGFGAELIASLARRMGSVRHAAEAERTRLLARAVRLEAGGYALLAPEALEPASDSLLAAAFGAVIATVGGATYGPEPGALDRLVHAWRTGSLRRGSTLGGCRIVPYRNQLLVCREPRSCAPAATLFGADARWDGRFAIKPKSLVQGQGRRQPSLGALGAAGIVALRQGGVGDRLERVPAPARPSLPAIATLDGLRTLPHLSYLGSGSRGPAGGNQPTLWLRPVRRLAEAPFSGCSAPARVAPARKCSID